MAVTDSSIGAEPQMGRRHITNSRPSFFGLPERFLAVVILLIGFVAMQLIHNDIHQDSVAGIASVMVIGVGVFLLNFFTSLRPMQFVWTNWRRALIYILVYVLIGVGYVGVRWSVKMWSWSSAYEYALVTYKKEKGITDINASPQLPDWQAAYAKDPKVGVWPDPRSAKVQEQARRWLIAWPWSLLQWFLGDFFANLMEWLTNFTTKMMVTISDYFTSGLQGIKK
jgi:hypothetical protein